MPIINLRKFYYPLITTDTFIEVSDEVAEALLELRREENRLTSKIWYHKAYFSLDCDDGIETYIVSLFIKELINEQENSARPHHSLVLPFVAGG